MNETLIELDGVELLVTYSTIKGQKGTYDQEEITTQYEVEKLEINDVDVTELLRHRIGEIEQLIIRAFN